MAIQCIKGLYLGMPSTLGFFRGGGFNRDHIGVSGDV